jgi:hypothetical protein
LQNSKIPDSRYDEPITLEAFSKERDYPKMSKEKVKRIWEAL